MFGLPLCGLPVAGLLCCARSGARRVFHFKQPCTNQESRSATIKSSGFALPSSARACGCQLWAPKTSLLKLLKSMHGVTFLGLSHRSRRSKKTTDQTLVSTGILETLSSFRPWRGEEDFQELEHREKMKRGLKKVMKNKNHLHVGRDCPQFTRSLCLSLSLSSTTSTKFRSRSMHSGRPRIPPCEGFVQALRGSVLLVGVVGPCLAMPLFLSPPFCPGMSSCGYEWTATQRLISSSKFLMTYTSLRPYTPVPTSGIKSRCFLTVLFTCPSQYRRCHRHWNSRS